MGDEFKPQLIDKTMLEAQDPKNCVGRTSDKPFAPKMLAKPCHRFEVAEPAKNPLPGQADARTFAVARGDVIQVRIDAPPRAGFVAVHGILEEHPIKPSGSIYVKLQAKYSGRFPLHFHGADDSHSEVAVFEVRPEP